VYADAAYEVLTRPSRECTGNAFLCEDVLVDSGVSDLSRYSADPAGGGDDSASENLGVDLFVDEVNPPGLR
jgi:citronellol/citronellal dehydrogenase